MNNSYAITPKDQEILRALAEQVAAYAAHPLEDQKRKLWTLHNDLKTEQPLVFIDPENGWNEIFPQNSLQCTGNLARGWEFQLRKRIYHVEQLKDDMVIDTIFTVGYISSDDGWGLPIIHEGGGNGRAYHIKPAMEDYEEQFEHVHYPNLCIDYTASDLILELAKQTFDGILQVERHTEWWWSLGLTASYIDLRGLENFLCDFITDPDWVHRMMELLCTGTLRKIDMLEEKGLLCSNNGNFYVGSGGFGFTEELPQLDGGRASARQIWGFVESQETSSISPEMYGEFIFPYHKRIAERFGLNCYGCCEPFEGRWEYVSKLPRLRRVSCSPWSSRAKTQELLGKNYIASHKLSPTPLASSNLDEDVVRRELRDVLDHSSGTIPELIMKDNHTLGNQPHNAVRWVELVREEIDKT